MKMKEKEKIYKVENIWKITNLRIESMSPGDLRVARCFNFSKFVGGIF